MYPLIEFQRPEAEGITFFAKVGHCNQLMWQVTSPDNHDVTFCYATLTEYDGVHNGHLNEV